MTGKWHARPAAEVIAALGPDPRRGLQAAEAARRLARDGPNTLAAARRATALDVLVHQFGSVVVWVLVGAALVSGALGETVDALAILAIVVLNAAIGFFQEHRAERAVAALARLTAPRARVVRDGRATIVPAAEVVRGDLLLLDAGDLVAADARLLEAAALRTAEAPLTGESTPVDKADAPCPVDAPLAERRSLVFLGTSIVAGSGRAVVVATGMATEVGRIATLLETAERGATPLERELDQVGRRLLWVCLAIVLVVFVLGLARAIDRLELFMSAVSLAVAAIPEGLPAVVTVALALGVQRMARRNALVRRLPAVETLGCADVVCTDKTGTLTLGEMTVRKLVGASGAFTVTGEGWTTEGAIFEDGAPAPTGSGPLHDLLWAAAAASEADLVRRDGRAGVTGDPTDGALLVVAAKAGITAEAIDAALPRLGTIPFDSDRKRMTVVRRRDGRPWAFVKGAPEEILARATNVRTPHGLEPFDDAARARMLEASAMLASDALRVLAIAERPLAAFPTVDDAESGLTFLGLAGLQDPPRAEARDSVARCRRAGIRPVMITGDHRDTASAIARELGILQPGDEVLAGSALDALDDAALAARVERIAVYARVTAEHKLRVVRAWKARGAVVAMTGDGVNDAPALKEASIGIAMGIAGTEVTKEAADVVLADDNFASIIAAVEEGRGVYDNIGKTLAYLLAGNAGELAVMLAASLVGWPLPLLPVQLLWVNLVTDGLPAIALATDPIDPGVLSRPPRHADAALADRRFLARTLVVGAMTATVTLVAFAHALAGGGGTDRARNAAFAVLVFEELLRAFSARSATRPVWEVGLFSNLRLVLIVAASFALQLAIHQQPALRSIFGTSPIAPGELAAWVGLGALPLCALEVGKVIRGRALSRGRRRPPPARGSSGPSGAG
jgi:Ca2+-transporting ATPase